MNTLTTVKNLAAALAICVTFSSVVFAQDDEIEEVLKGEALPGDMVIPYEEDGTKTLDMDALAEEMDNPLSELWFLAIQKDTTTYTGDFDGGDSRAFNNFKLQPVMSFPLAEDYNIVVRPVFQYLSYVFPQLSLNDTAPPITEDSFGLEFDRQNGFGDTILLTSFGPSEPKGKRIIAGGPTELILGLQHH